MKRCPNCKSKKFRENQLDKGKWKCFNCGFEWWNPTYHRTVFTKDYHGGDEKPQFSMINDEQFLKCYPQLLSVDFHDNVYKFEILKDNPGISIGQRIDRWKNSNKEILHKDNVTYQRTSRHIQISIKRRFIEEIRKTSELEKKDFQIEQLFISYAKQFQDEFNIKLSLKPVSVAKEVKPIEAFKSPVQFNGGTVKCVYPNGDIEWIGTDAVTHFKNFIENLSLESKADQIQDAMLKWNQNFELHYSVLNDMKDTLKLIQQNGNGNGNHVSRPEGFAVKTDTINGLWLAIQKTKPLLIKLSEAFK